jgi:peptidoglycan/xylan/chitin deacetylase (PgdA/CDA1 family)
MIGRRGDDVLVLCYHALSPDWTADLSVTPANFRAQLELLVQAGYRGATFSEAVTARRGRLVAVTFDDAFGSVHRLARPLMSKLGWPGTVFVPTAFQDGGGRLRWPGIDHWEGGPHGDELRAMSWTLLRELAAEGWEIGSHTRTHPRLTQLDDHALRAELRDSRAACERAVERPCRSIAYPYGDVDARVVAAVREAGYETGAALPARLYRPSVLAWPRIGIYHPDGRGRFALKVSRVLRRARTAAARAAAPG